jgi:hypothetical protein
VAVYGLEDKAPAMFLRKTDASAQGNEETESVPIQI